MDMKQIKALMREFDESNLSKMKIDKDGFSLEMEKAVVQTTLAPAQAAPAAPVAVATTPTVTAAPTTASAPSGDVITSPMVGTFYAAPSPDSDPFVKVGDTVKKGQVVAILEAMKIMNEIEAEFDCKILEVLVQDGQAIEYDMPLFSVEKL